tara:strand:- start:594 stop:767 length:174 start_codon:yes stop_codon:yes gene_type:complete
MQTATLDDDLEILLWEEEVMDAMRECKDLPFSPDLVTPSLVYQLIRNLLTVQGVQEV